MVGLSIVLLTSYSILKKSGVTMQHSLCNFAIVVMIVIIIIIIIIIEMITITATTIKAIMMKTTISSNLLTI